MGQEVMRSAVLFSFGVLCASAADPNYKPKPEDYRIVNGKLYNLVLSTNFVTLNKISGEHGPKWSYSQGGLQVVNVLQAGVVMRHYSFNIGNKGYGSTIIVTNLPDAAGLVTGKYYPRPFRAMRRGVYKWASTEGIFDIAAYDYGIPNTPENRKAAGIERKE
jgi:hypothetical protein